MSPLWGSPLPARGGDRVQTLSPLGPFARKCPHFFFKSPTHIRSFWIGWRDCCARGFFCRGSPPARGGRHPFSGLSSKASFSWLPRSPSFLLAAGKDLRRRGRIVVRSSFVLFFFFFFFLFFLEADSHTPFGRGPRLYSPQVKADNPCFPCREVHPFRFFFSRCLFKMNPPKSGEESSSSQQANAVPPPYYTAL